MMLLIGTVGGKDRVRFHAATQGSRSHSQVNTPTTPKVVVSLQMTPLL